MPRKATKTLAQITDTAFASRQVEAKIMRFPLVQAPIENTQKPLSKRLSPYQYSQYLIQKAILEENLAAEAKKPKGIPPVEHQQPRFF